MWRIKLVIADTDETYLENLVNFFMRSHSGRFQVNSFTKQEYLYKFLQEEEPRADILLVSPDLFTAPIPENRVKTVILLTGGRIPSELGHLESVGKYQHGDRLVAGILRIYSESNKEEVFLSDGGKPTRLIAVYSPSGGTGKTTIAVNLCMQCISRGLSSFYLNLESIPSTSSFFTSKNEQNLSHMLFYIKEKNKNLGLRVEALKSIDATGVHYFEPQDRLAEVEDMSAEELNVLLGQMKKLNQYDAVVVDMSSSFSRQNLGILKFCDFIVFVLDPALASYTRARVLEKELDILAEKENVHIRDKIIPIFNKYSPDSFYEAEGLALTDMHTSVKLPVVGGIKANCADNGGRFNQGMEQLMRLLLRGA